MESTASKVEQTAEEMDKEISWRTDRLKRLWEDQRGVACSLVEELLEHWSELPASLRVAFREDRRDYEENKKMLKESGELLIQLIRKRNGI